jgi:hypothetical protein
LHDAGVPVRRGNRADRERMFHNCHFTAGVGAAQLEHRAETRNADFLAATWRHDRYVVAL